MAFVYNDSKKNNPKKQENSVQVTFSHHLSVNIFENMKNVSTKSINSLG